MKKAWDAPWLFLATRLAASLGLLVTLMALFVPLVHASVPQAGGVVRLVGDEENIDLAPHLMRLAGDDAEMTLARAARNSPTFFWTPLQGKPSFAFETNVIWLKVEVENTKDAPLSMILANDGPLRRLDVVFADHPEKVLKGGRSALEMQRPVSPSAAVEVTLPPGRSTLVMEIDGIHQPSFLALRFWPEAKFKDANLAMLFFLALCYGAAGGILLYNFTLLFFVGQRPEVSYVIATSGAILVSIAMTGLPPIIPVALSLTVAEAFGFAVAMASSGFLLFTFDIIQADMTRFRVVKSLAIGFCLVTVATGIAYDQVASWTTVDILWIVVMAPALPMMALLGIKTKRRLPAFYPLSAALYAIASLLVIMSHAGFLPYAPYYASGQLVSLIVLLMLIALTVSGFANAEAQEKARLEQGISLGRSVQDLLLPRATSRSQGALEYAFLYEPHEGMMSGDWINHWTTPDGAEHFIIGDVTGKGPQAALAVAMIAMVIDGNADAGIGLEGCLLEINKILFTRFRGDVTTTATALTISAGGQATLLNAGGLGWFVWRDHKRVHRIGKGDLLGQHADCGLVAETLDLAPGDALMTFTDGVRRDLRSAHRLARELDQPIAAGAPLTAVCKQASLGANAWRSEDDQAMLVVRRGVGEPRATLEMPLAAGDS